MVEIKRINKLWSENSLHLLTVLKIPIWDPDPNLPCSSKQRFPGDENQNRMSGISHMTSSESKTSLNKRLSVDSVQSTDSWRSDSSVADILSRIDSTTGQARKNIRRVKKESRFSKIFHIVQTKLSKVQFQRRSTTKLRV